MSAPKTNPRQADLSMDIYAAMLGGAPAIDKAIPENRPRLKMRVRVEATLEHAQSSPFFHTTLREHIERCAAYAAKAIDDARQRLSASRPHSAPVTERTIHRSAEKPAITVSTANNLDARSKTPSGSRAA